MAKMSVGRYIATRVSTLKPPGHVPPNPFTTLRSLNQRQWQFFLVAFAGWTWDAFDFFTVSLTITPLAKEFGKTKADITWGITLVLMLRSIGAISFGLAADKWGRKWPFIINNVLFIILELGTGFCQTYEQFLGVRALFGIAMGGIYGNCAATALEDAPIEARGILSGMLQQGYAFGYLLATVFARGLVDTTSHGWRPLFWFGACPPLLIILFRMYLPETNSYLERQALKAERAEGVEGIERVMWKEAKIGLKKHWLLLIYMVLLMAGFNFMSHGSQDLYPTMLENQLEFDKNKVTVTQVVANLGAMLGGTLIGYFSQMFGRRLSIIVACIGGGALLYPYCFIRNDGVIGAAFAEQFFVQGAWGVIPIHLVELSPASARTTIVGSAYQLGNLVSSASSTIEATMGEKFRLSGEGTTARYNYGLVMAIFMGCVFAYVIVLTFIGPEALGRDMAESTIAEDLGDRKGEWEDGEKAGAIEDEGRRVPV
ncbi:major facilitator superfamily domain-containing protein [Morchella snyderi]|nr:major facilitator superfamily domain-containing protein [Morchella snyderi]